MSRRAVRLGLLMVLTALALVLSACGGNSANKAPVAAAAVTPTKAANALPAVRSGSSVMAEGKLVPARNSALSLSASGVVSEVLVKDGDIVQAGQALVRLAGNEKLAAAVSAADLEVLTAQTALNDLVSTADLQRSQAQLTLATAQKDLNTAKNRTYSKDFQRGTQEQVDIARANYIIAEDGVKRAEELYNKFTERAQDDPMRAEMFSQMAAARQKRDTSLANLNYLLNKPNDLDVNEVQSKLAVAQSNVAEAQRKLDLLKNGPDANQLALAQARVNNAIVSRDAAKASQNDLELKAPFAGTVTAVNTNPGEAEVAGTPVVTLADFSTWNVETTDLTELNVARVKVGQPAMIRFDALPGLDLIGRVTEIKAFGENRQGDVVYTVVLKLERADERLRWNMTASVTFLEKDPGQ